MRRARQAAGGFAGLGVGEGDAVALMLRNDIAGFEATLGAAPRRSWTGICRHTCPWDGECSRRN